MGKERFDSVDVLKGILMIYICCFHIGNYSMKLVYDIFIGVSLFFLISGFFYKPNQGFINNIKRRVKQILLPFLLYSAIGITIVFVILVLHGENISIIEPLKAYGKAIIDNWCMLPMGTYNMSDTIGIYVLPMWFLIRLFISEIIMFAIADWAIKSLKRMIIAVSILLSITFAWGYFVGINLPFQLNTCFAIAAILLAGAYIKQQNVLSFIEQSSHNAKYRLMVLGAVALSVVFLLIGINDTKLVKGFFGLKQVTAQMWKVYPWFLATLSVAFLLLVLSKFIAKIPIIQNVLKIIGKSSLMILCSHQVLAFIILTIFGIPLTVPRDATESNLLIRIVVIVICLVAGVILSKIRNKIIKASKKLKKL